MWNLIKNSMHLREDIGLSQWRIRVKIMAENHCGIELVLDLNY